jgi:hypothetical protein
VTLPVLGFGLLENSPNVNKLLRILNIVADATFL